MRRSPVRRNVVQHFTFVFSPCRLGFRPPDLTGFGLLPREGKRDLPELDLHSLPVFKALIAFLLPQKRLHNCKEPDQFVCFSFSKLPTSLSCFQLHDVFPSGQGSTESQRFIHKPMESLIKKFHISQALFSIIQTAAWSQGR